MKKQILLIIIVFVSVKLSFTQFTLSGEFRPRTEMSHGYSTLAGSDQDVSIFTSQRTRLNFNYKTENLKTKLVLQDVRVWGNQAQLVSNEDFAASIHEAWAEFTVFENASVKVGRMELVYDNHRIFGSVNWAQQARSHDIAVFKYESTYNIHAGLAFNQNTNRTNNYYAGPNAYKNMQFIWVNRKSDQLSLSLLFLNNGVHNSQTDTLGNVTDEPVRYSQTLGIYETYKLGDLSLNGSFYYQFGKDGNNNDLSAFQLNLEALYTLSDNVNLTGGYELLSGTDYNETGGNKSFTPFYGTNHKFNGFMDYFYVGNHSNNVGLNDIYVKANYKKEKLSLTGFAHFFLAHGEIGAGISKGLGTEIDLVGGYKISDAVSVNVGYSHLIASDAMQALKGGNADEIQNWAWLMIKVTPKFIQAKEE